MAATSGKSTSGLAFGQHLKSLRRRAGLTQEQLAERSGCSAHTISNIERGAFAAPRADTATLLADALGLDGAERARFFELIEVQREGRGPESTPDAATPAPSASAVPAPDGGILGREVALARLLAQLGDPAIRIVTLVGPGGVGKTRLALEAARRVEAACGEVAWAALESLGSADEALPAIARAVGASGTAHGDPVQRIAEAVSGRDVLLVVDNCEHVIEAAAGIAAVIASAPRLTVLATSREALRVGGERRVSVAPLPVPAAGDDDERIAANPAVGLFVDRAASHGQVVPDLSDVRRIVTAVDGMPLAIELAAAQVEEMTVGTVAALLDQASIEVLETGRRDVHRRLRSMEHAVRWSYDLVGPGPRRLLRVLSVFRGGADLELLGETCARLGEPELARSLPALVRASLASDAADGQGGSRIRTLSPIRLFAAAELEAAGERTAAEAAHRETMLGYARRSRDLVASPDALAGLDAFERERDNLVAALDRAIQAGDGADAIEIASAMAWWWENRSEVVEGVRWLDLALAVPGIERRPDDATWALAVAFLSNYLLGRYARSADHAAEMERIARLARRDDLLGAARVVAGDLAWGVGGDLEAASSHYAEGLALLEPHGPTMWLGQAHTRAADAATERGDLAVALVHIDRTLAIRDVLGHVVFRSTALFFRGSVLAALGRNAEARSSFLAGLEEATSLGQPLFAAHSLLRLACLDAADPDRGCRERSALLLGAALGLMAVRRIALDPMLEPFVADARAALDAEFGAEATERLLADGREVPMAKTVALASASTA